jgi:excisionase family DNA binding protein
LNHSNQTKTRRTRAQQRARATAHSQPTYDHSNDPGQPKLLLTVQETAERLNISAGSVYRRIMSGEIPSIKIGALRRIPVHQLERYLDQLVSNQEIRQPDPISA